MNIQMKISEKGLNLIKYFESFSPTSYVCPAGYLTIGYGHVILEGETFNEPLSNDDATNLLAKDISWVEKIVNKLVLNNLTQDQFDAVCSLVFNIGSGNFSNSTLLKLLNAGDFTNAAYEFVQWNKANNEVFPGLEQRRLAETELFLSLV